MLCSRPRVQCDTHLCKLVAEVGGGLHIVIIPENVKDKNNDGLVDKPNDSAKGGIQTYKFDPPRDVKSFVYVDADRKSIIGTATAFDANDNIIKTVSIPKAGDASVQTITMNAPDTTRSLSFVPVLSASKIITSFGLPP